MKKRLLTIALMTSAATFAQQVPNGGFESWADQGTYEEPTEWATPNILSFFGAPISVTKSTDAVEGSYSVKLENTVFDLDQDGMDDVVPGTAFIGSVDFVNQALLDGIPFTYRPDSLYGWTKYSPFAAEDGFAVQVSLTKWDASVGARETIGEGVYTSFDPSSTFQMFDLLLTYNSEISPDTLSIFIVNTINQTAQQGTVMWADDFEFTYSLQASLNENANDYFKVYPVPAEDNLFIRSDRSEIVELVDLAGNVIEQISIQKGIEKMISVETYDQGMYFIRRSNGTTTKFIVTK